jgi:putative salt-induced outer membrane protein YdiY/molybdopterin-binding protein
MPNSTADAIGRRCGAGLWLLPQPAVTLCFVLVVMVRTIRPLLDSMNMRNLLQATVVAALSAGVLAQDKITLGNGDVITGTIKTMADGKVTITSPLLGDVVVPMANINDMVTQSQVALRTTGDDTLNRRILGIENGALRLEGDTTSLDLAKLSVINPPPVTPPAWTGSLKLNGFYASGNTDRRTVGLNFDASRRSAEDRLSVDASWDYSEDKDGNPQSATFREWRLNQRRAGGGLKYDYFLSKKWYALVTARVLGDTLANLDLRYTSGVGLGYTWIEDSTTTFLTEVGVSYLNESYRNDDPSVDFLAVRAAYKLTHAFSDKTRLVHGVEAFPSTEESDDVYFQAKTEISTSLTDSMVASVAHSMDYDNTPATGAERADHRVLLSVGWTF